MADYIVCFSKQGGTMIYLIVKIRGISLRTISQKLLSDHSFIR